MRVLKSLLNSIILCVIFFGTAKVIYAENSVITVQPQDFYCELGETAIFAVEANGDALEYQWEYSRNGDDWMKIYFDGYDTAQITFEAVSYRFSYFYRCRITDRNGNIHYSNYGRLLCNTPSIEKQPTDCYCDIGDTAVFTIEAAGSDLTYRWEYSRNGVDWMRVYFDGYNTPQLSVEAVSYRFSYMYRCCVIDLAGRTYYSDPAAIKGVGAGIIGQPSNSYCTTGEIAKFNIEATGRVIRYQWQYSRDDITWQNVYFDGYNTNELSVEAAEYRFSYKYRCQITDINKNIITSDSAELRAYKIIKQPQTQYCMIGDTVKFSVEAQGDDLTYSWEYRKRDTMDWTKLYFEGHLTSTMYIDLTDARNGYQIRCVIKDKTGKVLITDTVYLYKTALNITEQPKDAAGEYNQNAAFYITATGDGLKYKWQFSREGDEWENSYFEGYDTNKLTVLMSYVRRNYKFRCIVTDKYGNSITSDTVGWKHIPQEQMVFQKITSQNGFLEINTGIQMITPEAFHERSEISGAIGDSKGSISYLVDIDVNDTDIMLLRFNIYASSKGEKLNILLNGEEYASYPIGVQESEIRVPVTGYTRIESITLETETATQNIYVGDMELISYGQLSNAGELEAGIYMRDEYSDISYDLSQGIGSDSAKACLTDDNYLYVLGRGNISVWSLDDPLSPQKISDISGLGDTRDMKFCNNNNTIAVTARSNGVYFVDISDKNNLKVVSHYDTLELVSGLYIYGDYAFLCSRYFGIETIDISDINDPVLKAVIQYDESLSEYIDCCVSDGYLYVGVWGQRRVDIYDVRDLSNIELTAKIDTDGNAHGVAVQDDILCIATGFHSNDNSKNAACPGYGMGNGMEIYDISDKENPKWLSTSKIDGRFYCTGNDIWKISVSGDYAFYTDSYNGLYIYDISDPGAPIRKEHHEIKIPYGTAGYKRIDTGTYVFPYDTEEYMTAPVFGAAIYDDYVYLPGSTTDVFVIQSQYARRSAGSEGVGISGKGSLSADNISDLEGYIVNEYRTDGSVYAADTMGDHIVLACGAGGIEVLDSKLNKIDEYKTETPVKDIKIGNGVIYTAECSNGIGAYSFDGADIKKIGDCKTNSSNCCVTSMRLTADEQYIISQASWTGIAVFDIKDPLNIKTVYQCDVGSMYYRNMVQGSVSERYVGVVGNSYSAWFTSSDTGAVERKVFMSNPYWVETNGAAAAGDEVIIITGNGYVHYDPFTILPSELPALKVVRSSDVKLVGKPIVYKNTLIVSTEYNGMVTIMDISDIDAPKFITQFKAGDYVDVVYVDDRQMLLPLRSGGLVQLIPV